MSEKQILTFPIPKTPSNGEKIIKFFLTPFGHRVCLGFAVTGAVGCFSLKYLPHTVFVEHYRDFITSYSFGIPKEVPAKLKKRVKLAAKKLKIDDHYQKCINTFIVTGLSLYEIGSMKSTNRAWIGIPTNYFYKTTNDVDTRNIFIRSEPVKWHTEYGKQLKQSLILTEDEQIFSFCRAILELKTFKVLINSLIPSFTLMAMYGIGNRINAKLNLYARPFSIRLIIYSLLSIFGYGIYSRTTDFLQCKRDRCIDNELAALGPDVIKAGISYYEKQLQKNIAIRELSGQNFYTVKGNENFFLRTKSLPITTRKQFFIAKLAECEKREQEVDKETNKNVEESSA